jgi:hypothetical protein
MYSVTLYKIDGSITEIQVVKSPTKIEVCEWTQRKVKSVVKFQEQTQFKTNNGSLVATVKKV